MSIWDKQQLELHEDSLTNIYIDNLEQGIDLIGRLLRENNDQTELSKEFGRFSQLVETNFLEMAGRMGIPENASIYHELLLFQKRLEEFIMFPELFQKKIVAVGGGFSAGKSKLINLLIGEELLPTDTTPTTSIPTYIMEGSETLFFAHNLYGLKSELDEEAIKAITHAFSEKYKVSLAQIMKNILLKSASMKFKNIALLDTPGYSKSDHHKNERNKDEHMARVHLHSADCLIWVVDIEKGTIPNQDFEFIKSMNTRCPIFFVFNKADKKEASDIEKIIETASENVMNQGLPCAGIGAISALLKKEYGDELLFDFLKEQNEEKSVTNLREEMLSLFAKYEQYTEKKTQELRSELRELNEIALNTSEKEAQDLLKPLIAEKKKKITREKDNIKQFQLELTPFISSIENIQELLSKQSIKPEGDLVKTVTKRFFHQLLKINVEKMVEEKVNYFVQEIRLSDIKRQEPLSGSTLADLLESALLLLQKDIKLKLAKELARQNVKVNELLSHHVLSEMERAEVDSILSDTFSTVSEKIDSFDFLKEKSQKLTNIIYPYKTISRDYESLVIQMVLNECTMIGNDLMEKFFKFYQETITTLLEEKWGQ